MASYEVIPGPIRAALVGGGFIGPVHAEALRRIGVEVAGLLGSTPERARPLADRLSIGRVYRDLDELRSDKTIQSVHVASPNDAHFAQVHALLESGLHVVCEKPLAISSEQTRVLRDLAASRPKQAAAVNYNVRFYPLCHEMRARIARGDIGRVLSVTGSYVQDWLLYPNDFNWRVTADGGTNLRAIADIGTHWMDLAQFVTSSKIDTVFADLATFHPTRFRPVGTSETFSGRTDSAREPVAITTEDHGAVLLRFDGGARGLFHVSQVTAGRKNRIVLEVAGTEGSLTWNSESAERLWIGHRDRPNEQLMRDPALMAPSAGAVSHYPGGHAEGFPDTFKQLFLAVYRWIGDDGQSVPGFPTFEDGHREVLLCEAIARSAREETWVEVDPP